MGAKLSDVIEGAVGAVLSPVISGIAAFNRWRLPPRDTTGFLIPARPWASWKARFSYHGVTGSRAFRGLGNNHAGGRAIFHHSRRVVRS